MSYDAIPLKLHKVAESAGYHLEHHNVVRRRGWPTASAKPFILYFKDGSYIASFATLKALENNLRARAGC